MMCLTKGISGKFYKPLWRAEKIKASLKRTALIFQKSLLFFISHLLALGENAFLPSILLLPLNHFAQHNNNEQ